MRKFLLLCISFGVSVSYAQTNDQYIELLQKIETLEAEVKAEKAAEKEESRLTLGGYGEMTMSRHFYSDAWQRYAFPSKYADDGSYGRFDVPHAVFYVGYDFGSGWSFGSEIEFEHGGVGSTIEIEEEETGEYESEIEQGGEVVLEQFWINKSWSTALNLKMGHIMVPVGFTNKYHLPNQYFGVFRPEGDSQILPTAWHQSGVSFWGRNGSWSYELMLIAGLDADRFSPENWIGGSANTPYEFKIANNYATAFSLDNRSLKNLTVGLSGYYGHSADNTLNSYGYSTTSQGAVLIGALDLTYTPKDFILRGGVIYGTLGDSYAISYGNSGATNGSPTPSKPAVGSAAMSIGVEAGYNLFGLCEKFAAKGEKLYAFGRYEYYDSMYKTVSGVPDYAYWERECVSVGLNYSPIAEVTLKAEYQMRNLVDPTYNDENTFAVGITWAGFFTKRK